LISCTFCFFSFSFYFSSFWLCTFVCTLCTMFIINIYYLRLRGYVFARVCLSVCDQDNSKSYGKIFLKFSGNVGNGKNYKWFNFGGYPETLKFSLTLLQMGHKGNRCQTEYGDATWRTTWRWRRSAVSDCFSGLLINCHSDQKLVFSIC